MGAVFISYRRGDSEGQARALSIELGDLIGKDSVFMDVDSIALGRDFRQVLQESLQACDIMLALIGPNWLEAKDAAGNRRLDSPGDFVRQEISSALKRNIAVTPVLLQEASMPTPDRLPDDLKDLAFRNGFEISHTRWESDVREMLKRLGLIERTRSFVPPRTSAQAPASQVVSSSAGARADAQPPAAALTGTAAGAKTGNAAVSPAEIPSARPRKSRVPMMAAGAAILVVVVVLAWMGLSRGKPSSTASSMEPKTRSAESGPGATRASFDSIVSGVKQIALGEKGVAGPVAATADGWVTIASADKNVDSPKAFVMARQYQAGRVAAFGHPGFLAFSDKHPDNPLFIAHLVQWLAAGKGQKACFTVVHGEPEIGPAGTPTAVNIAGFEVSSVPATINSFTISGCSVVVINNRTTTFTSDEVQTVQDFVTNGNGLLLGGLGWAYAQNSPTKNIQDYPMLQLGRIFGVEWPTSHIGGPDAGGLTTFRTFYPNAAP
jgi:TIR domain